MRRVLVLLFALALSGCWLQPGYGPGHQNSNPFETGLTVANVDALAPAWRVPGVSSQVQPLVTGSTVFTESAVSGQSEAVVQARGRGSGALRWEQHLPIVAVPGTPPATLLAVNDSQVLMYTMGPGFQSTLTALDPATGATLDSATLGGLVFPNMVVADDLVVAYLTDDVSTSENTLVVRSRSTLDVLWSGHPGPVETPVLFGSGRLYTQTSDGSGAFVRAYATQGCGGRPCATRCSPCPCRRRPSPTTASRRGCSPPPTTATSSCSGP